MEESLKRPKILISTGIYPPAIGGPSEYARNLKEEFQSLGLETRVRAYGKIERVLPTGFRHLYYFFKIIPAVLQSDYIVALDTFSVGFPSVLASRIFNKKCVIRTGGDFLWEQYVERTGDMVLLRNFYEKTREKWSPKEKIIFRLTQYTLSHANAVIWSTLWQRDIFNPAYNLSYDNQFVIENYYGEKLSEFLPEKKNFIASTRKLKWKNIEGLQESFWEAKKMKPEVSLETDNSPYEIYLERIRAAYGVILVSLGDISPNMILDAIRGNVPFILTEETGLRDKLNGIGIFVDPLNKEEIAEKIIWLSDENNRESMRRKIADFNFTHSWREIAEEFLGVYHKIS